MRHLDDFTVDYFAVGEDSQRFLDMMREFEKREKKTFSIANNVYFGRLHVGVYIVEEEENPALVLWMVLHGEESVDAMLENGMNFGQTARFEELDLVRTFKNVKASLVSADQIDSDFPMIITGPDSVICFVDFEEVKALNRDELSKIIVREYVKKLFGVEKDFTIRTDDMSIF